MNVFEDAAWNQARTVARYLTHADKIVEIGRALPEDAFDLISYVCPTGYAGVEIQAVNEQASQELAKILAHLYGQGEKSRSYSGTINLTFKDGDFCIVLAGYAPPACTKRTFERKIAHREHEQKADIFVCSEDELQKLESEGWMLVE